MLNLNTINGLLEYIDVNSTKSDWQVRKFIPSMRITKSYTEMSKIYLVTIIEL